MVSHSEEILKVWADPVVLPKKWTTVNCMMCSAYQRLHQQQILRKHTERRLCRTIPTVVVTRQSSKTFSKLMKSSLMVRSVISTTNTAKMHSRVKEVLKALEWTTFFRRCLVVVVVSADNKHRDLRKASPFSTHLK